MSDDKLDYQKLRRRPGFLIRRRQQVHLALFVEQGGAFRVTPVGTRLVAVPPSLRILRQY
jgi:hypothetical protein